MNIREAVIVDAVRTPMAKSKNGMFRNRRADDISGDLCDLYLAKSNLPAEEIEDVIWGCVQQTLEQGLILLVSHHCKQVYLIQSLLKL